MSNKTETINLDDYPTLGISSFANAFTERSPKLPTPCQFFRENKLKNLKVRRLKDGNVRIGFTTSKGKEFSAIQRNFQLCYIRLVRNFQRSNL